MSFLALFHPGHTHTSMFEALFHRPWFLEATVAIALVSWVAWRRLQH